MAEERALNNTSNGAVKGHQDAYLAALEMVKSMRRESDAFLSGTREKKAKWFNSELDSNEAN